MGILPQFVWIEIGVTAGITLAFLVQAFFLFRPEHLAHGRLRAKIGAGLQGIIVGSLVGLVILPLRIGFFVPEFPGPQQAIASTAVFPALVLLLVIRRGLLARAPLIGRYLRAYRRAALLHGIDVARQRLARLEAMDRKQRADP